MTKFKKIAAFLLTFSMLFTLFAANVYAESMVVITETINKSFPVAVGEEIEVTVTIENNSSKGYSFNLSTFFGKQDAVQFINESVTLNGQAFTQYSNTLSDNENFLNYQISSIPANSTATLTFNVKALTSSQFKMYTEGSYSVLSGSGIGAGTIFPVSNNKFTVIYYPNGGSGTGPAGGEFAANDEFNANVNTYDAPDDKKFDSWNTKSDGTGDRYVEGDKITMPNQDLALYAIWKNDDTESEDTGSEGTGSKDTESKDTESKDTRSKENENPQTSDSGIYAFILLAVVSASSMLVLRRKNKI